MRRSELREIIRETLIDVLREEEKKRDPDKYYANFKDKEVGPYDTEKDAWHDTRGDVNWIKRGSDIREDTTLRSLVAKADSEQLANQAVLHLKKRGIEARAADESTFGLNRDESEGWGVFVEPGIVNKAAKALASVSKGLEFDPYTRTSGGD